MRLAKSSPWSVVYPTLVDVNASDEEPPEELQRILDCLVITTYYVILQLWVFFLRLKISHVSSGSSKFS